MELAHCNGDRRLLVLPPILDLAGAAEFKRVLEVWLESKCGLDVDASRVRKITTPCLQILLAAFKSSETAGGSMIDIANPSAEFDATVRTLGLETALKMEGARPCQNAS